MIQFWWSPSSLTKLVRLSNSNFAFRESLHLALDMCGQILIEDMQQVEEWRSGRSTGKFNENLTYLFSNDLTLEVGNRVPYAWRRYQGFTGMTDSLGRFYRYDPASFFLDDALAVFMGGGEAQSIFTLYLGDYLSYLNEV